MSGFGTHLRVAVGAGTVGAALVYYTGQKSGLSLMNTIEIALAAFLLTVFAGVLPDVDVHSSIPRRLLGKAILPVVGIGTIVYAFLHPSILDPVVSGLLQIVPGLPNPHTIGVGLLASIALVGATAFGSLFDSITVHRGFFHSPILGVALGLVVASVLIGTDVTNLFVAGSVGLVVTGGFFSHIITDKVS